MGDGMAQDEGARTVEDVLRRRLMLLPPPPGVLVGVAVGAGCVALSRMLVRRSSWGRELHHDLDEVSPAVKESAHRWRWCRSSIRARTS